MISRCAMEEDPIGLYADLMEENPLAVTADGLEGAYLGPTANHHHSVVAVYDLQESVRILMQDGMSEDEAVEYMSCVILSADHGENGPLFVRVA